MEKTLDFWFEFASPYSYPAAMRVAQLAEQVGVTVRWRVFLLGAVFKQYGWQTTPDKVFPAKGDYMWRDLPRVCNSLNLPYQHPSVFPRNGMLAARICALYANEAWLPDFVRFVYQANFAEDQDISSVNLISSLLAKAGQNSDEILAAANADAAKQALKDQTQHALSINVFGAPFMMVGDEPFWGNDRLEQAIYFAANGKLPSNVTLS